MQRTDYRRDEESANGQREGKEQQGEKRTTGNVRSYRELHVYQNAIEAAMRIFEATKTFPPEERFSMTDQLRRSARSVCTHIAEAWRKRRDPAHFASKLSDSEAGAEETRVWLELAAHCGYLRKPHVQDLDDAYDKILAQLVRMIMQSDKWTIRPQADAATRGRDDAAPRQTEQQSDRGQSRQSYRR